MIITAQHASGYLNLSGTTSSTKMSGDSFSINLLPGQSITIDDKFALCKSINDAVGNGSIVINSYSSTDISQPVSQGELTRAIAAIPSGGSTWTDPDIKVSATVEIPVIAAGARTVVEFNVGELTENSYALVSFFDPASYTDEEVQAMAKGTPRYTQINLGGSAGDTTNGLVPPYKGQLIQSISNGQFIMVFEDYQKARRFYFIPANIEAIDYPATEYLHLYSVAGWTYGDIAKNVLAGWYSMNGNSVLNGLFGALPIVMEGAWLENVSDDTIIHIVFKNLHPTDSTSAVDLKCCVWE